MRGRCKELRSGVCRPAEVRSFGGDGLCRLGPVNLRRPSLVAGQEFRQWLCGAIGEVRWRLHLGEPQWLGEPTGILEQTLGLFGHLALLEVVDELPRRVALGLTNRFEDPALGDAAEIVVDRR